MSETTNALFEGLDNLVNNGISKLVETPVLDKTPEDTKIATLDNKENKEEKIEFSLEEIENFTKAPKEEDKVDADKDLFNQIKKDGEKVEKTDDPKNENKEDKAEEVSEEDSKGIYQAVSEIFKQEGFIDKEFDSAEKMVEVFSKRIEEEVNDYKESLPPILKELINNYEEGVPLEDLIKSRSEQIKYSNVDEEKLETDEDLQKAICKEYMKNTTRFSEEKINKEIKKLAEAGELFDEAKSNKKELVALEKEAEKTMIAETKKRQEAQRLQDQKVMKEIHKTVSSVKEIIPGIKLSDKENEELFKMITTPVELIGNQPVSHAMKVREADPVKFDLTLNYLIKKGVFEGKWDSIMTKVETKAVNNLEKQLKAAADKITNKGGASAELPETDKTKATLTGLKESLAMRKASQK